MGILNIDFLSESILLSASSDKSIKLWDLEKKDILCTLLPSPQEALGIEYMQTTVGHFEGNVVSISLSGKINIWEKNDIGENALPNSVILGHKVN
jgi:WD40 repeat protein